MANEVWTFAEQTDGHLDSLSYELLGRGRALADKRNTELASVILGYNIEKDGIREGPTRSTLLRKKSLAAI
ncbi:hypothetical protein ACFL6H_07075 [Candidatus Latescibacterota bacterium]